MKATKRKKPHIMSQYIICCVCVDIQGLKITLGLSCLPRLLNLGNLGSLSNLLSLSLDSL